jgi:glycosyltransferase involved in cell wall biosynthesis
MCCRDAEDRDGSPREALFLQLADNAFVPSSRAAWFLREMGLKDDRIFSTPYVVDSDTFQQTARRVDRTAGRMRLGVPSGVVVDLFVGKLIAWKRSLGLLEAASRVEGIHVVAGDGELRSIVERRANEPDLTGRVQLLGFANQAALPEVYAFSDVLVLPSKFVPFGLVVNEAFAAERPTIVSGGASDPAKDGETGYVVWVGDVEELADRLHLMAGSADVRQGLGEAARRRIASWAREQNAHAFAAARIELTKPAQQVTIR